MGKQKGHERHGAQCIVLMGVMGSGKSSIARMLSKILQYRVVDNDAELASRLGMSTSAFSAAHGIDALHQEERSMFFAVCSDVEDKIVCAPGSSAEWLTPDNFPLGALGVWLDVPPDVAWERIHRGSQARPQALLQEEEVFQTESMQRRPLYESCARIILHGEFAVPDIPAALIGALVRE